MPVGRNSKLRRHPTKSSSHAARGKQLYRIVPQNISSVRITLKRYVHRTYYKHSVVDGTRYRFTKWHAPEQKLDGYRVINMELLQQHVTKLTLHAITCSAVQRRCANGEKFEPIKLVADVQHHGLASVVLAQCQGCMEKFYLHTSPKVPSSAPHNRYDINVRAVWGTMVSGGGASRLNETLATMSVPGMSQTTFGAIEQEIGEWWKGVLEADMLAAGTEERRLAIARNDYCDGVPAITVVCDGGWSKRSHKHSYNALGGVAIIIGAETGKLLHIGVRNKHCYTCSLYETRQQKAPDHQCFKNWVESSQAMEADVIVEGFLQAELKHGVRYTRLVGDGDSSVFARVQEQVPVWGCKVEKLKCSNHACKCLRSSLENWFWTNRSTRDMAN